MYADKEEVRAGPIVRGGVEDGTSYIHSAHGKSTRLTANTRTPRDTDNPQQTSIKGKLFHPHIHLLNSFFLISLPSGPKPEMQ